MFFFNLNTNLYLKKITYKIITIEFSIVIKGKNILLSTIYRKNIGNMPTIFSNM